MKYLNTLIMIGALVWSVQAQAQVRRVAKPTVNRKALRSKDVAKALKTPVSRYSTKTEKLRALRLRSSAALSTFELRSRQLKVSNKGYAVLGGVQRLDGSSGTTVIKSVGSSMRGYVKLMLPVTRKRYLIECRVSGGTGMAFELGSSQQSSQMVLRGARGRRVDGKILAYVEASGPGRPTGFRPFTLKLSGNSSQVWNWRGCEVTLVDP